MLETLGDTTSVGSRKTSPVRRFRVRWIVLAITALIPVLNYADRAALVAGSDDRRLPFVVLGLLGVLMTVGWWVLVRDTPADHPWARWMDARGSPSRTGDRPARRDRASSTAGPARRRRTGSHR